MNVIGAIQVSPNSKSVDLDDVAEEVLQLSEPELAELRWTAGEGSPSMSRHARIILLRHEGRSLSEISKALGVDRATVRRWVQRFRRHRLRGLVHASTGKARKRRFDETIHDAIVRLAMEPPTEAGESFTHWSLRRLRAHVIRRGIVRDISVEGLRQMLMSLPLPEQLWRRGGEESHTLSEEVRSGLESLTQTGSGEVSRRARIVLARGRGLNESEIASALSIGRSCVRRWLKRFDRHGMLGLQTARRPAHPVVFTAEVRAAIARCGRASPRELGMAADHWSLRALRNALIRQKVVRRISIQHLRRILGEAGVVLRPQETHEDSALKTPAHG